MYIAYWTRAGVLTLAAMAPPLTLAAPEYGGPPPAPWSVPALERPAPVPLLPLPVVVVAAAPGLFVQRALPPALAINARIDERALDAYRGGTDLVSNDAHLGGLVGENAATNVSTGGNSIDGASFANVSGIPVVIQNSGANVLIQNSTIINLQLK